MRRVTRNFSGQGKSRGIRALSLKTPEKNGPAGKIFGVFSPRYS